MTPTLRADRCPSRRVLIPRVLLRTMTASTPPAAPPPPRRIRAMPKKRAKIRPGGKRGAIQLGISLRRRRQMAMSMIPRRRRKRRRGPGKVSERGNGRCVLGLPPRFRHACCRAMRASRLLLYLLLSPPALHMHPSNALLTMHSFILSPCILAIL